MPYINNTQDGLLQGLSSFWLRLFADRDQLSAMYQGSEQLLGQAYLDLLESVLARTLKGAPRLHREQWKLITVRQDRVTLFPGASTADDRYSVELPDGVVDIKFLQNGLYAPTVLLETGFDFEVDTSTSPAKLKFISTNPFTRNGVASRMVDVVPTVKATGTLGKVTAGSALFQNLTAFGSVDTSFYNAYNVGDRIVLDSFSQGGTYTIIGVTGTGVTLDKTFTSGETGLRWRLESPARVKELAFWAPQARMDLRTLADAYGYLVDDEQASTEAYRDLLQGIFQFYTLGAGLQRMCAALQVSAGLAVTQEEETVVALGSASVVTSRATYTVPSGRADPSITVGQVLPAFTPLTDVVKVYDSVSNPTWWWNITLPQELVPDLIGARLAVSPQPEPSLYADGAYPSHYGDPGLYYGADSSGAPVVGNRPPLKHSAAYILMERLLKTYMFGVFVDLELVSGTQYDKMKKIVEGGKPAYTILYLAIQ